MIILLALVALSFLLAGPGIWPMWASFAIVALLLVGIDLLVVGIGRLFHPTPRRYKEPERRGM